MRSMVISRQGPRHRAQLRHQQGAGGSRQFPRLGPTHHRVALEKGDRRRSRDLHPSMRDLHHAAAHGDGPHAHPFDAQCINERKHAHHVDQRVHGPDLVEVDLVHGATMHRCFHPGQPLEGRPRTLAHRRGQGAPIQDLDQIGEVAQWSVVFFGDMNSRTFEALVHPASYTNDRRIESHRGDGGPHDRLKVRAPGRYPAVRP